MNDFDENNNQNSNSLNNNPEQYGNQFAGGYVDQNGTPDIYEAQNLQQGYYYSNQPGGAGYDQNAYASQQISYDSNGYINQFGQQNAYVDQAQAFSTAGETTVLSDVNPYVAQTNANNANMYTTQAYPGADNSYATQMTANDAYASNDTQLSKKGKKTKKQKTKGGIKLPRFVISIIAVIIVAVVIGITDNNTKNDLIGTWEYVEPTEYDEVFTVDVTWNFVLTEDSYMWKINEEDTKESLLVFYDKLIDYYEITEETVKLDGYTSLEDFKQTLLEADMADLAGFGRESGTWRIEEGEFLFKRTGESEEYRTDYRLEGDTLELLLDEIVLTRVKNVEQSEKE